MIWPFNRKKKSKKPVTKITYNGVDLGEATDIKIKQTVPIKQSSKSESVKVKSGQHSPYRAPVMTIKKFKRIKEFTKANPKNPHKHFASIFGVSIPTISLVRKSRSFAEYKRRRAARSKGIKYNG